MILRGVDDWCFFSVLANKNNEKGEGFRARADWGTRASVTQPKHAKDVSRSWMLEALSLPKFLISGYSCCLSVPAAQHVRSDRDPRRPATVSHTKEGEGRARVLSDVGQDRLKHWVQTG